MLFLSLLSDTKYSVLQQQEAFYSVLAHIYEEKFKLFLMPVSSQTGHVLICVSYSAWFFIFFKVSSHFFFFSWEGHSSSIFVLNVENAR